jgi:hypothetical protein
MATSSSGLTARVNDRVRERSYADSDEPISFFCECGEHCFRTVWLTADAFDLARLLGEPLLAAHAPLGLVMA